MAICRLRKYSWNSRNAGRSVVQCRERLEEIITPVPGIQVGGYLEKRGVELFRLAKEKGLEGIIAKEKVIRTRGSQPVPAFPALLFSLPLGHFHLLSQVVTHIKTSGPPRSKPRLREPQAFPKPKICFRSDLILWVQT